MSQTERAINFLSWGVIIGLFFGLIKAISAVSSHRYFEQKMYRLILFHFASNLNQGIFLGFIVALSFFLFIFLAHILRKFVFPFFEFRVIKKRNLTPLVTKSFLILAFGYWLFHFLKSAFTFSPNIQSLLYQVLIVFFFFFLFLQLEKKDFRLKIHQIIKSFRSSGIRKASVGILSFLVLINLSSVAQKILDPPRGPNILLVVADALRPDHLGCYGYDRPTSPFIDEFAKESLVFEKAISNAPWTKPSMASIFTSLYPHEHKAFHWPDSLPDANLTLAEIFRNSNYKTFSIQANEFITKEQNFDQGFERYEEMISEKGENINSRFSHWLKKNKDRTFFAYLHYMDTHLPYETAEKFNSLFEPNTLSSSLSGKVLAWELRILNEIGLSPDDKQRLVNLYDAEIRYFDSSFKKIIDNLKVFGIYDKTIIILTSDHGEEFWEHQGVEHGHTLCNEVLHVPLIIRYSSHLPSKSLNYYVQLVDLFPTLLSLSGIKKNFDLRGQNLVPYIVRNLPLNREIFIEATCYGAEKKAIIKDGWKLVENTGLIHRDSLPLLGNLSEYLYQECDQTFELYNLNENFKETQNLIDDCLPFIKDLKKRLLLFNLAFYDYPHPEGKEREKKLEDLKSLGYIK